MRNLIVLGVAGLLAVGLSMSSMAGLEPDSDGDGLVDSADNCTLVDNGPVEDQPGGCYDGGTMVQLDGDQDGYGNPCDTDVDNDQGTSLLDVSATLAAASAISSDPNFDFDCDGGASLLDVSRVLADAAAIASPGPSGLACAGTITCP